MGSDDVFHIQEDQPEDHGYDPKKLFVGGLKQTLTAGRRYGEFIDKDFMEEYRTGPRQRAMYGYRPLTKRL